ncbi:MAG: hypothetical protein WCI03_01965 [bacterium]|jgi:hypothetical protein
MNLKPDPVLRDLFHFRNGTPVTSPASWLKRRSEMQDLIVGIEYGGLPPKPDCCYAEELHTTTIQNPEGSRFISWRIIIGLDRKFSFLMTTLIPPGNGPFPVVLTGDTCWRYATDEVAREVLSRGAILAQFNRVELAPDINNSERVSGLYRVYPEGTYGALAAWAWGYHRCIDALVKMSLVRADQIAVTGHSRGGKTVLLAGATDERIALTAANNSGAGGAGSYKIQGPQSETLADCLRGFPYWYGPTLKEYLGRESELPFDQHYLKALIAPRALLTTEALGDLWANPTGTWQTYLAAREVYRFLKAEEKIGIAYREGGHAHDLADWSVFLDFMDWQFKGQRPSYPFDRNPF